jgi:hypothetical protein
MKITLQITETNGSVKQFRIVPVDFMAWENHPKPNSHKIGDLANGASLTDMLFMAYSAAKRTGDTTATFEDWALLVEAIEAVEQEDPKLQQ